MYAYLQMGADSEAATEVQDAANIARALEVRPHDGHDGDEADAIAAIPARFALETGNWSEASALTVRQTNAVYADAITHFARALGAARNQNLSLAGREIAELHNIHGILERRQYVYWARQVDIQRRVALAWTLAASGKVDDAIKLLRAAADGESATEKPLLSPGPILPARELLGELLLDVGRAADAAGEFEKAIATAPNRFRGVYGAGMAAEKAGDPRYADRKSCY